MFEGIEFPFDKWIGMKYIIYNQTPTSVKLELYIDKTLDGDPSKAIWEKVRDALDEGKDWSGVSILNVTEVQGCKENNGLVNDYDPILEGHGTFFL